MASLSVCVFSNRSPGHLATILAPYRGVASELVVALEDRGADFDLAPLRDVADKVIVAPFAWPLESNLGWLMAQCSGDWLFRVDGDEVPSRALIDLLASDAWHRGVTHCYVPRRWLIDGGRSWIKANPWWPDLQLRLIRNDAEFTHFGTGVHEPMEVAGRSRVLPAAIYHLDLLDRTLEDRREKTLRYYRQRPELRTFGGLSMGAYYTPELMARQPPSVPLSADDRLLVRPAMENDLGGVDGRSLRHVGAPLLDPGRPVALDVEHVDPSGYAGRGLELLVKVTNTTSRVLDPFAEHPFRIGCQWRDSAGTTRPEEGRADLPRPLPPGTSETVMLPTRIPPDAGEYRLSIGAVEEGRQWLLGAPEIRFTALDQPRITFVGGYSPFRHLGDDMITRSLIEDLTDEFPEVDITLLADDPDAIARRFEVRTAATAAPIHHANIGQGLSGIESIDHTTALALRCVAGEPAGDRALADLVEVIRRSDLLVLAAAGSLAGKYADWVLWPRLIEAEVAAACGVPVVITNAGIGPFTAGEQCLGARRLMDLADEVHVRDPLSLEALTDLGSERPVTVSPDAASWFKGGEEEYIAFLTDHGISRTRPYVVASVRAEDQDVTLRRVAECVEASARTLGAAIVLVPHCVTHPHDDRPALTAVADLLTRDLDVVLLGDIPPDPVAAELVRNARASVGTRFHNAVLSASAAKPAIVFFESEYDERRARGLAAMPAARVSVADAHVGIAEADVPDALGKPAEAPTYPKPRVLPAAVRRLGVMDETALAGAESDAAGAGPQGVGWVS